MIDPSSLKSIEDLHRLKTEGIITEAEFEQSKQKILFGAPPRFAARTPSGPIPKPAEDDHVGWIILPLKRYVDFEGRSSRKEFWMFQLIYVAVMLVSLVLAIVSPSLAVAILILACLALVLPLLAAEIRRFHDQNMSGWFALLNLIPYIGPVVVFVLMLSPGTKGDNRFGPDPTLL
jgi:uncharacterized membrane protein YhaH (DUF805 family)